jgi:hypothetical protein
MTSCYMHTHNTHPLTHYTHTSVLSFGGLQPSLALYMYTPQLAATVVLSLCNTACACSALLSTATEHTTLCTVLLVMLEDKHELRGEACDGITGYSAPLHPYTRIRWYPLPKPVSPTPIYLFPRSLFKCTILCFCPHAH